MVFVRQFVNTSTFSFSGRHSTDRITEPFSGTQKVQFDHLLAAIGGHAQVQLRLQKKVCVWFWCQPTEAVVCGLISRWVGGPADSGQRKRDFLISRGGQKKRSVFERLLKIQKLIFK